MKCSVIIPTYNRERLLRYTLASLAGQSLAADQFEVLVVDDGSSDGTEAMVRSFADRLDVRYFFQEDKGYRAGMARNVAIAHATSEICVFIDAGVVLGSDCLQAHVDSHWAADGPVAVIGYVYCLVLSDDDQVTEQMDRTLDLDDPDATIALLERQRLWTDIREPFYAKYGNDFGHLPAPWVIYWTSNVSASTALVREVGMFDEGFEGWGGEDIELAYRLYRAGALFVHNPQAAAIHAPHRREATAQTEGGNLDYFIRKHPTPIVSLLPGFTTWEVTPLNINDIIEERNLPRCADFERQARAA